MLGLIKNISLTIAETMSMLHLVQYFNTNIQENRTEHWFYRVHRGCDIIFIIIIESVVILPHKME